MNTTTINPIDTASDILRRLAKGESPTVRDYPGAEWNIVKTMLTPREYASMLVSDEHDLRAMCLRREAERYHQLAA
jgi:hypothetical protein